MNIDYLDTMIMQGFPKKSTEHGKITLRIWIIMRELYLLNSIEERNLFVKNAVERELVKLRQTGNFEVSLLTSKFITCRFSAFAQSKSCYEGTDIPCQNMIDHCQTIVMTPFKEEFKEIKHDLINEVSRHFSRHALALSKEYLIALTDENWKTWSTEAFHYHLTFDCGPENFPEHKDLF